MAMMTFICTAQNIRPIDLLRKAHSGVAIKSVSVFKTVSERNQIVLPDELKEGEIMVVDRNQLKQVLEDDASFLQIEVPTGDKNIVLELVEVNPLAGDAIIRVAPSMQIIEMPLAKHFRGIIQGDQSSLVALSIFDDEVMGFVSSSTFSGNMVIGKLENTQYHIAYEDQTIQDLNSFECKTEDINLEYTTEQLRDEDSKRDLSDCVRLYLEVNNDIYNNKGSTAATTNYITGLFNQVATLYANEQINVNISEILIWTTQSPYTSTTSSGILNQFTGYRQGFNGDLAQLLSYQASGGIAYLDGLCRTNPDFSMSYAGISSSYQNVPTYSWSVMVCTHEFGHLMGSNHTHACAWNGNSTAIDGCYTTEGGCSNPGVPQGGGTIMSYCHLTSAGINFNLGFGPQPGSVIRYEVTNASCLQACPGGATCSDGIQNGNETGVDCGGSCSPCDNGGGGNSNETLVAGHYFESGWDGWIDGGTNCYRYGGSLSPEGTYSIRLRNRTGASSTMTSPVLDLSTYDTVRVQFSFYVTSFENGEDFWLNYYNGSTWTTLKKYTVGIDFANNVEASKTFLMIGSFPTNAKFSFQADASDNTDLVYIDAVEIYGMEAIETSTPTCDDGIQNGSETGIDCGGTCPACDNGGGNGSAEVFAHYFESGWDNWQDGGTDCYRYYGSLSPEGNYSIRLRDNSGDGSTMFSPAHDLSTYNALDINFQFSAVNMISGQSFKLKYFNGTTWSTIYTLISGTHFTNNQDYNATITVSGTFHPNAKIAFECNSSGNSNLVYIDAIVLTGYYGSSLFGNENTVVQIVPKSNTHVQTQTEEHQLILYPNPTSDQVHIQADEDILQINVYSSDGKLIKSLKPSSSSTDISMREYHVGMFLIEIRTEENTIIKKIMRI